MKPQDMRVLFLLSRLHCQDGIASHLATLLRYVRQEGWIIDFVVGIVDCPPEAATVLSTIRGQCESFTIDPAFAYAAAGRCPFRLLQQVWRARWHAREKRSVVIHLHGKALGPPTFVARMLGGSARVYTKHLAHAGVKKRSGNVLRAATGRLWGDRCIAISRAMIRSLREDEGIAAKRLRYIPHGVDLEYFRPPTLAERTAARQRLGLPLGTLVCLQLARVGRIKRPETLASACVALVQMGIDTRALFAGHCEAAEREFLEKSVPDAFRSLLCILGQQDARSVIWAADVFVLCSEREGFAISVVEAMACGLPVVRTSVEGAIDQIADGVDGFLFDVDDKKRLADILRNLSDPSIRNSIGGVAREKATQMFSAQVMARRTCDIYLEVI